MTQGDPHNLEQRLENTVQSLESEKISSNNQQLLERFYNYLVSQELSNSRVTRHLRCVKVVAEYMDGDLSSVSKSKMVELVGAINQNQIKDTELADSTKAEYRKSLIKFYSDFLDTMKDDIRQVPHDLDGEKLTDFFTSTCKTTMPDPETLPEPDTIRKLVRNAPKTRDKTLLMLLWSTGGRISEILGLKWKDVRFKQGEDKELVTVVFRETKTGENRKVPIRTGFVYLKDLKQKDPRGEDPDAWVFRSEQTKDQLSYRSAYKAIQRAERRADLEQHTKTNPHAFRKARATFLASQGMNQATLCEYMGWVQGSDQASVYIALAESDKENTVMELAGIKKKEENRERDLLPVKCHECGELNRFETENCRECGQTLTTASIFKQVQIEEKTEKFMEEIIRSDTEFNPEEINQKAEEFVKEEFSL
ncbi:tyrosine-type recombinase/integrase [Nanohaloarchaea archaeon H01]|nr:tyrosine-type recombinase/integrase [Nanohaloarchaea archaeon H01]